jgi:hypothetical protein
MAKQTSLQSPKADVARRLQALARRCRAHERKGLRHFGELAAVLDALSRAFEALGHEPALWLLAVAAVAGERAEALVLERVADLEQETSR